MPEVSIVMSSYNHELYIADTIESFLNQSFSDLELIIVDDASTDGSADIIRSYQRQDNRIHAVFRELNQGSTKTFNEAMGLCKGNYIGTCSSDDLWFNNAIEILLERCREYPNHVVMGNGISIDANGHELGCLHVEFEDTPSERTSGDIFEELLYRQGPYFFIQTMLVEHKFIADLRMDESYQWMYEYVYFLELARRCPFHFTDDMIFMHRIHGDNQTFKVISGGPNEERARVARYYLRECPSRLHQKVQLQLCRTILLDAIKKQNFDEARYVFCFMMSIDASLADMIQNSFLMGLEPEAITFSLEVLGCKITFSMAWIGLTLQDAKSVVPVFSPD